MTLKNIKFVFVMMMLITITVWFSLSYHSNDNSNLVINELPDAYMEEVNAVVMNKQGKVNMKIATPFMVHYKTEDRSQLTLPRLTIYRKSPLPWYVTAKYAKTRQGTQIVEFWDNVVIHHPADEETPATVIKTSTLTVHPDDQTADTNDPITLIQPNTTINATGMHANMNTGDIKLLSQARGIYVPSS